MVINSVTSNFKNFLWGLYPYSTTEESKNNENNERNIDSAINLSSFLKSNPQKNKRNENLFDENKLNIFCTLSSLIDKRTDFEDEIRRKKACVNELKSQLKKRETLTTEMFRQSYSKETESVREKIKSAETELEQLQGEIKRLEEGGIRNTPLLKQSALTLTEEILVQKELKQLAAGIKNNPSLTPQVTAQKELSENPEKEKGWELV